MDTDRIAGAAKETLGKAEAGVGDAFGDGSTQASGYARQAAGAAQNTYGQAKDTARDVFGDQLSDATDSAQRALNSLEAEVKARPLIALLIAALIGYVLAQLTTR